MRVCALWCLLLLTTACHGVIYHLNDTEYNRMPRLFEIDRYDSCLSDVNGLYCVVKLDLYPGRASELMELIKGYSAYTYKHYNYTYIERGVCVTKTCRDFASNKSLNKKEDLHSTLEACLNYSIWNEYHLEAKLSDIYNCDKPNDQTSIDVGDWMAAVVFVILISLTIIGTVYDGFYRDNDSTKDNLLGNRLLMNFSLLKNWNALIKSDVYDPRENILKGLHGLRSIGISLTIIAHVIFINSMAFTDQPHEFEKAYETFYYHLIYNGLMIVQIFFLITALLQAYHIEIYSETSTLTWSQLPKLLFVRWWRLTPANAVMIGFTATWLRHVGSGPLWRLYVTDSVVAQCRRFWWLHLIYLNNYQPEDKLCALQTWYVAADTQLFVVGMLLYLATKRSGRTLALSLMMLVSMAAPAIHVWLQDLDGLVLQTPEVYRHWQDRTFHHLHVLGHNNLSCHVLGLVTGISVYHWQKNNVHFARWGFLSWLIIPAIGGWFLTGRVFFVEGERVSLIVRALYAGTHRAVMGALVAMIVVSLTMRLSGNVIGSAEYFSITLPPDESFCSFFEWNGWLVPSRLTYSVYLLHMNLVHILLGLRTQLGLVSTLNMLVVYFGVVVMSLMMAVPFYLVVEAPMTGLLKFLFKSRRTPIEKEKNEKKIE